jgi:4'-phosphopantetheinyl transferase
MIKKISEKRIDIWQADLDQYSFFTFDNYFNILNSVEKEKASKFKQYVHKKYYILSHAILRLLLSKYINVAPELISIHEDEYGKPFLKSYNIHFNISHSNTKLAIAIAKFDIGIDIEYINPNFDIHQISDIALSENEKLNINRLKGDFQKELFYSYWTKKEALLKGVGTGINIDLNKLEVLYNSYIDFDKENRWFIYNFNSFDKNYIGHIAFKREGIINYYSCKDIGLER